MVGTTLERTDEGIMAPFDFEVEGRYDAWKDFSEKVLKRELGALDQIVGAFSELVQSAWARIDTADYVARHLKDANSKKPITTRNIIKKLSDYIEITTWDIEFPDNEERMRYSSNLGANVIRFMQHFKNETEFLLPREDREKGYDFLKNLSFPPIEE